MSRKLPNLLTFLRVVLTCLIISCILIDSERMIIPLVLSLLVFASDFADGRIARRAGCTSHFGAIFDVTADLFYISAMYGVLVYLNIAPLWFLAVIVLKFTEFVATSYVLKRYSKARPIFIFDLIGRVMALLFYGMPLLLFLSCNISLRAYNLTAGVTLYAITAVALVSTFYRVHQIYVSRKDVNLRDLIYQEHPQQD